VFKFRQGIQVIREKSIELEGEFFVRHAPHLVEKYQKEEEAIIAERNNSFFTKYKTQTLVAGTFLLVVAFLAMENYLSFRKTLISRQTSAEEYLELIKDGLLKKYPYLPTDLVAEPIANHSFIASPLEKYFQEEAGKKKIVLLQVNRNFNNPNSFHKKALKRWEEFCKLQKLNCRTEILGKNTDFSADLFVVPSSESLSSGERDGLSKLISNNKSLIFTGPTGYLNGLGKENTDSWFLKSLWPDAKITMSDEARNFATKFYLSKTSFYDLPSELMINWAPLNNSVQVLGAIEENQLVASDFLGEVIKENEQVIVSGKKLSKNVLWVLSDPMPSNEKDQKYLNKVAMHYSNQYLLQSIVNLGSSFNIGLGKWPKNADYAMLFSVIADQDFLNLDYMTDLLEKKNLKSSVFLKADFYENFYGELDKDYLESDYADIALRNLDNQGFENISFKESFSKVESGRLLIERKSKKIVRGFLAPKALVDTNTVNAAYQNGLKYIVGEFDSYTTEPIGFQSRDMKLIPIGQFVDTAFIQNQEIVSPDDLVAALENRELEVSRANSIMKLHAHTHVLGDTEYRPYFKKAILWSSKRESAWKSNYIGLLEWLYNRSQVRIQTRKEGVSVQNLSLNSIEDLVLYSNESLETDSATTSEQGDIFQIEIPKLESGKTIFLRKSAE
jgi:hypothetical protein